MSLIETVRKEIKSFLDESGMAPTTFGERAIGDRTLVIRLRKGSGLRADTIDKIRLFIADEKKSTRKPTRRVA